ncbi:hypothetical protein ACO0K0_09000 [Undibacterium sp. SXout11W]|uniref:hypothetical protein n=1 Tax=Undibacterium sp. SXout11W TaxID=3413050 RepID=UPI003BF060E9
MICEPCGYHFVTAIVKYAKDVKATCSDVDDLVRDFFENTEILDLLKKFSTLRVLISSMHSQTRSIKVVDRLAQWGIKLRVLDFGFALFSHLFA